MSSSDDINFVFGGFVAESSSDDDCDDKCYHCGKREYQVHCEICDNKLCDKHTHIRECSFTYCSDCVDQCSYCGCIETIKICRLCHRFTCDKCDIEGTFQCIPCLLEMNLAKTYIQDILALYRKDMSKTMANRIVSAIFDNNLFDIFQLLIENKWLKDDTQRSLILYIDVIYLIIYYKKYEWFKYIVDRNEMDICFNLNFDIISWKSSLVIEYLIRSNLIEWIRYYFIKHEIPSMEYIISKKHNSNLEEDGDDNKHDKFILLLLRSSEDTCQFIYDKYKKTLFQINGVYINVFYIFMYFMERKYSTKTIPWFIDTLRKHPKLYNSVCWKILFNKSLNNRSSDFFEIFIEKGIWEPEYINDRSLISERKDMRVNCPRIEIVDRILLKELSLQKLCFMRIIINNIEYDGLIPKYILEECIQWFLNTKNDHIVIQAVKQMITDQLSFKASNNDSSKKRQRIK